MANPSIVTDKNESPRRSLMLAGGGMRLAYQAGVIKALQEADISFCHVDGTSGGIFNTAMLASGVPAEDVGKNWRRVKVKNFTSPNFIKSYFKPLNMTGYTDADGIRYKVFPALGIDIKKMNANQSFRATFNVCNFSDKTVENIPNTHVKEDHLIAGVSLPIVMPALKIDGKWYSDSVWIKDANLVEAVKSGADELWLVWAIGNFDEYLPGALNQYVHMIEMSADGGLLEEFAQIKLLLNQPNATDGWLNGLKLHVIKPEVPLPLDTDLFFNKIDIRTLINMGYSDARNYLAKIPEKGIAFTSQATKMQRPGFRLNFRVAFDGQLTIDGKKVPVFFYPAFCLHESDNSTTLSFVSSIAFEHKDDEISTYANTAVIQTEGKDRFILVTAKFLWNNGEYALSAHFPLTIPADWFLGLSFKSVKIDLSKAGNRMGGGTLYSSLKERFAFIRTRNLRQMDGTGGGIVKKWRMLQKMYS